MYSLQNNGFFSSRSKLSKSNSSPLSNTNSNTLRTPISSETNIPNNDLKKRSKTRSRLGDRMIPERTIQNLDLLHFKLASNESENKDTTPQMEYYKNVLADTLFDINLSQVKSHNMINFSPSKQDQKEDLTQHWKNKNLMIKNKREISKTPYKVLDAPGLSDDYYLNLLDWSERNILSVALENSVYLWNGDSSSVSQLCNYPEQQITSLSWSKQDSNIIAVGLDNSEVHIYDVNQGRKLRSLLGHNDRVGSLAWNNYLLSTGSRDSSIINHDLRQFNHIVSTYQNHTQEVVGLKWSNDGSQLASGGNDNLLNIWNYNSNNLQYCLEHHKAAVKAIAWCPFKSNLLATGGGSADRMIRFWNTSSGVCLNAVDTKSQVCSLLWSKNYKELVSSHGYTQNQICVWKYPTMEKISELTGHESRVLHMAMSPDGKNVASAAGSGDETIRFWKVFDKPLDYGGSTKNRSRFSGKMIR